MALCLGSFLSTALLLYTREFGVTASTVGLLIVQYLSIHQRWDWRVGRQGHTKAGVHTSDTSVRYGARAATCGRFLWPPLPI